MFFDKYTGKFIKKRNAQLQELRISFFYSV